jgi:Uri superfamily endonuclease
VNGGVSDPSFGPAREPDATVAPAPRLYIVLTHVPRRSTLKVGSLGAVTLDRGWYAYVGSAAVAREARVARHLAREKPLRWHADYLFARFPGRLAWLVDGELTECEIAGALARLPVASRRPPRFGAGDCRCAGHLLRLARRPTTTALAATVPGVCTAFDAGRRS